MCRNPSPREIPPREAWGGIRKTRRLFCPTSQESEAKINLFPIFKIMIIRNHPALTTEGVSRSPRCVARGAVDGPVSQASETGAYGEVAWSWSPDAGINPRSRARGDGG